MTPRAWLTTADAAAILSCSPHYIGYLARRGTLPSRKDGKRLLVDDRAVRARAAEAAQWVSYARAAELVRCAQTTIVRAIHNGRIERRKPEHRAQPALSRASVEAFAVEWAKEQAGLRRRRAQRKLRRSGPPATDDVWLTPAVAAMVLNMTTSRLRQLAQQGRVPFTQFGPRRWYRRDHIEQLAAARRLSALRTQGASPTASR